MSEAPKRWETIHGGVQRGVVDALSDDRTEYAVFDMSAETRRGLWSMRTMISECRLAAKPELYGRMLELGIRELDAWGAK